jgi:hypothetical protein
VVLNRILTGEDFPVVHFVEVFGALSAVIHDDD